MAALKAKQSREGVVPELLNELCSLYAGKSGGKFLSAIITCILFLCLNIRIHVDTPTATSAEKVNRLYALASSVLRRYKCLSVHLSSRFMCVFISLAIQFPLYSLTSSD